jgi:hypothetical protein
MRTVKKLLSISIVVVACLLSVATSGTTSRQRTAVPAARAWEFAPQIAAAAEELGYRAYTYSEGASVVHVDLGGGRWIYYQVVQDRLDQVVHLTDELEGDAELLAIEESEVIARQIWDRAMEMRRELSL